MLLSKSFSNAILTTAVLLSAPTFAATTTKGVITSVDVHPNVALTFGPGSLRCFYSSISNVVLNFPGSHLE